MKNWISKSVFAVFYYSRICWASFRPSFVFVFVMVKLWSLLLAAVHLLSQRVCHFLTFHQTRVICLFSLLCLPLDAVSCCSPAQPLFFSSLATVLIMHALFLLEKAHLSSRCWDHND